MVSLYCNYKNAHLPLQNRGEKMNKWFFKNETSKNGYIWYHGALTEIVDWNNSAHPTSPQHILINPLKADKIVFKEFISIDPKNSNNFLPFIREFGPLIPFSQTLQHHKIPGIRNLVCDNPDELESSFLLTHKKPEQTAAFYEFEHFDLNYANDLSENKDKYPFIGYLSFEDVATPSSMEMLSEFKNQYSDLFSDGNMIEIKTETKATIHFQQPIRFNPSDDKKIKAIAEILCSNIAWNLMIEPITPFISNKMIPIMTSPGEYFENMFVKFSISAKDFNNSTNINHNTIANIWLDKFITYNTSYYPCEVRHHFDPVQNKWAPLIRPSSLLAAMWYQLTEWLAGEKKYRQCKGCNAWMDITDKNSNNYFHADCANRLRVRKSRLKKAVLKLFAEGYPTKDIANMLNQLEVDVNAILTEGSGKNSRKN